MRVRWLMGAAALLVCGCTDRAQLVPGNAQAQAVGTPVLTWTRGVPGGFLNVRMPDGESLAGHYSISEQTAKNNFNATAAGPRTSMTCVGTMIAGQGTADCQANNGAVYHVQL